MVKGSARVALKMMGVDMWVRCLIDVRVGNAFELVTCLDDESIDCVVTSPPYYKLRDYGTEPITIGDWTGELGQETTPDLFVEHLVFLFDLIKPKLKETGTVWVNLGDTYSNSGGSGKDPKRHTQFGKVIENGSAQKPHRVESLPSKCLCMVPERFALKMIEHGWILRNVIIWNKPNKMPESVKDRFTHSFEYIYFFVKNKDYYFEQQFEPLKEITIKRAEYGWHGKKLLDGKSYNGISETEKMGERFAPKEGKNKRCVWDIPTKGYSGAHFACFNTELIKTPILSGCPEGGMVLDPFGGSGTVGEFCKENGRNAILFELNPEYEKLIVERCKLNESLEMFNIKKEK